MNIEYWKRSQVTGKKYDYFSESIIRIINLKQAMSYLSNGAELMDIYTSRNRKTNDPVLVFVFNKNEKLQELYDLWCKHKLEIKDFDIE